MKLTKQKLKEIIKEEVKKTDLTKLKSKLKKDVEDAVEKVEHQ
tara:strand:+ start:212 stop:340 length:129 start_codon:yes stop_codon:yes gene_type:complete